LEESEKPTVMAFERIFARWKLETTRWLQRGIVGGWWDGRGFLEVDVALGNVGLAEESDGRKNR